MINAKLAKTSITQIQNAAQNLIKQFAELSAALATESEPAAEAALEQFYSVANLFYEMTGQIWEEHYQCELEPIEHYHAIGEPSFDEIEQRMTELDKHLKKLSGASHDWPARFKRLWLKGLCQRSFYLVAALDFLVSQSIHVVESEVAELNEAEGFMPDFSHRLSPVGFESGTLGLLDTVNMAANKLLASVNMLSDHFALDDDENRPSDETVFFALQSIKHEAQDIKAIVEGFHRNEKL